MQYSMMDAIEELGLAPWEAAARYGTAAEKLLNPPPGQAPQAPANIMQLAEGAQTPAMSTASFDQPATEPVNFLQTAAMPLEAPQPAPMPAAPPPPSPPSGPPASVTAQPPAGEERPRKRLSLLDVIGRASDVIAKVGGAEALYQPTLDAREDRVLSMDDRTRRVTAEELEIAKAKFDLGDSQNLRLGQAARGLKAIQEGGGDITRAWPVLAQRMGLDPETAAQVGEAIATDPNALDGIIAATTDPKLDQAKYGGSVVYGIDQEGKLVAYQPGLGNRGGRNVLPEGVTPIDPQKFVDTGGTQVGVGTRSGKVVNILPKTARPDTIVTARQSDRNNARTNATNLEIAGMPARTNVGKPGGAGDGAGAVEAAQATLADLRQIYGTLNDMGAMVTDAQSADKNIIARIRASGIGQTLEGAVGTKAQAERDRIASIRPGLMQMLAKATGMTGKQLDSNADVKLFMQTVTDPTRSYSANIDAINRLERFLKANAKKPEAATPRADPKRPKAQDGWSLIKVD